ncbi:chaperone NapD [Paracoccus sp. S1E-3]|uniref:chaperone NapD n=1 Tax=Paracoccus sp. S1E-3 TaxID=2756130 RepID=UPI001C68C02E|nr:chaperone NapD [Paracoccus sp. S1E-3]
MRDIPSPDQPRKGRRYHLSSAVVAVLPGRETEIMAALPGLAGVEVHAVEGTRIVVTIEGYSTGELGDRLTTISAIPGVIAANMVFEHSEAEEPQE